MSNHTPAPSLSLAHGAPSDDELRHAFADAVRHRPHWPRTFDAARLDPLILGQLQLLARALRRVSYGRRTVAAYTPIVRAAKTATAQPLYVFDQKRRAAGEKPDED